MAKKKKTVTTTDSIERKLCKNGEISQQGMRKPLETWGELFVKKVRVYGVLRPIAKVFHISYALVKKHIDAKTPIEIDGEMTTFDRAIIEAKKYYVERSEMKCSKRAFDGILKDIYYRGEVVGQQREYSDRLAMFLLSANDPKKYRKDILRDINEQGGKIEIVYNVADPKKKTKKK